MKLVLLLQNKARSGRVKPENMTGLKKNNKLNLVQKRQEIIKTTEIPQPKRRGHYRLCLTRVIFSLVIRKLPAKFRCVQ